MKQGLGLIIGLIVGAVGAVLFSGSLAPHEGSPEERLEIAEIALGKARRFGSGWAGRQSAHGE
jgi:hypothetical protein